MSEPTLKSTISRLEKFLTEVRGIDLTRHSVEQLYFIIVELIPITIKELKEIRDRYDLDETEE